MSSIADHVRFAGGGSDDPNVACGRYRAHRIHLHRHRGAMSYGVGKAAPPSREIQGRVLVSLLLAGQVDF